MIFPEDEFQQRIKFSPAETDPQTGHQFTRPYEKKIHQDSIPNLNRFKFTPKNPPRWSNDPPPSFFLFPHLAFQNTKIIIPPFNWPRSKNSNLANSGCSSGYAFMIMSGWFHVLLTPSGWLAWNAASSHGLNLSGNNSRFTLLWD